LSSIVAEGSLKGASLHELVTKHTDALLGDKKPLETDSGEKQFPLLIKFLDAREDLSIQVHPTPEYVKGHKGVGAYLKTECWIVVDNAKGSFLYKGLKPGVTREQFEAALKGDGHNVKDLIATVPAREGDCHFLPSGVIHALGAGTLVAEVQTPSDTTYRVYDFNRIEAATGKPRTLHINQALECIDFAGTPTPAVTNTRNTQIPLVKCEFFETRSIKAPAHTIRPLPKGEMKIWMVTEGVVRLKWAGKKLDVNLGQTVLLPAHVPPGLMASFPGNASYIETVLP
jgi:mannose-6-phosphate isomerase